MTQINLHAVIDHLQHDIMRALENALENVIPDAEIDRNALYKEFRKAVHRKCPPWAIIPDQYVNRN